MSSYVDMGIKIQRTYTVITIWKQKPYPTCAGIPQKPFVVSSSDLAKNCANGSS